MAEITFSVRMDENLKCEFEAICNYLGMNMETAINVFARAVVRERRIPFELSAAEMYDKDNALQVFNAMRQQAKDNGVADMSVEDVDAEIDKTREEFDQMMETSLSQATNGEGRPAEEVFASIRDDIK